ncbi:MAG: hypothetical protein J6M47_09870 [Clostridia bacterium]|nr:hypothetical protein [Clostridia bacterium]
MIEAQKHSHTQLKQVTNIELLAEDIMRMKHKRKIMQVLPLFLADYKRPEPKQKGGVRSSCRTDVV